MIQKLLFYYFRSFPIDYGKNNLVKDVEISCENKSIQYLNKHGLEKSINDNIIFIK